MFEIIRNADVEAKIIFVKESLSLQITIDNRYEHQFSAGSRESKLCLNTNIETIQSMFYGGTYFIYKGKLVDYRLSNYKGFTHTTDGISQLAERIGLSDITSNANHSQSSPAARRSPASGLFNQQRGRKNNGVFLGGEWDKFDLNIRDLGIGGEFENKLIYRWSPFSDTITTSLEVERLVCANGMVASSPFVTFEVPLINDWERNLHVISAQLQPRISDVLTSRFSDMAKKPSSVFDVQRAHGLLLDRRKSIEDLNDGKGGSDITNLNNMLSITDAEFNLGNYYRNELFSNTEKSKLVDAHLTQFDVFNILTEASSHYGNDSDSNVSIQRDLNRLVFDEFDRKKQLRPSVPTISDSDHRRAFFGSNK